MDRLGNQFLSGAAFTENQYIGVALGGFFAGGNHIFYRTGISDNIIKCIASFIAPYIIDKLMDQFGLIEPEQCFGDRSGIIPNKMDRHAEGLGERVGIPQLYGYFLVILLFFKHLGSVCPAAVDSVNIEIIEKILPDDLFVGKAEHFKGMCVNLGNPAGLGKQEKTGRHIFDNAVSLSADPFDIMHGLGKLQFLCDTVRCRKNHAQRMRMGVLFQNSDVDSAQQISAPIEDWSAGTGINLMFFAIMLPAADLNRFAEIQRGTDGVGSRYRFLAAGSGNQMVMA